MEICNNFNINNSPKNNIVKKVIFQKIQQIIAVLKVQ